MRKIRFERLLKEHREKQKETQPTTNTVQTSHTCKFTTYTLKQAATCDKEGSEV